jgi:hypothetical protein
VGAAYHYQDGLRRVTNQDDLLPFRIAQFRTDTLRATSDLGRQSEKAMPGDEPGQFLMRGLSCGAASNQCKSLRAHTMALRVVLIPGTLFQCG